ncbi:MAG: PaaI family thioesterase [Caulobacteraceae bacterium]|nr:PaaI family thioesterase [Caulobacteraceae bacterium]
MSALAAAQPPEGFKPHRRRSPLTDPWTPIYVRETPQAVILGLSAREPHVNGRGFVHGGLIMALCDNAMGLSCVQAAGGEVSMLTVNMTVDFLETARIGQWLTFETEFVRPGGTLAFAQAFARADGRDVARANGVFRVVRREAPAA